MLVVVGCGDLDSVAKQTKQTRGSSPRLPASKARHQSPRLEMDDDHRVKKKIRGFVKMI
jgi:hypothetical protein